MKTATVDPIQLFCTNFECDLDLRIAPGGAPRFIRSVEWPDLEVCFRGVTDAYDRRLHSHKLEILLKRSRYSIETVQLVLASKGQFQHLNRAIMEFYSVANINDFFHCNEILTTLEAFQFLEISENTKSMLVAEVEKKFGVWLARANDVAVRASA